MCKFQTPNVPQGATALKNDVVIAQFDSFIT